MNRQRRALVIEDDDDLRRLMTTILSSSGFLVTAVGTGAEGLAAAESQDLDLITLDLTLPDTDGLLICRGIREVTSAYLLILTARHDEVPLLVGLAAGADDYMTKPFSKLELSARVSALMRRPRSLDPAIATTVVLAHGDLQMDPGQRTATIAGADLPVTRVEFDLLAALATRPEQLVTRADLLGEVWGSTWSDSHLVDVHVANLRRKMRLAGGVVEVLTVRGMGYRLHRRSGAEVRERT